MLYNPNFDLYRQWSPQPDALRPPYVAVFRRGAKTLVYLCDAHRMNKSFDMVDWVFDRANFPKPDVFLTEMTNDDNGRTGTCNENTLRYAAATAAENGVPVVFADLSNTQMVAVLDKCFPDNKFSQDDLEKVFNGAPVSNRGVWGERSIALNRHGRDKFMLQNIAAALNTYDTVYAIFGEGHFYCQRLILEDMLGTPQIMDAIPNMRRDFGDLKVKPIKLIEFKAGEK